MNTRQQDLFQIVIHDANALHHFAHSPLGPVRSQGKLTDGGQTLVVSGMHHSRPDSGAELDNSGAWDLRKAANGDRTLFETFLNKEPAETINWVFRNCVTMN